MKIREYWCKPGTEHPNGCRTVWAQGKILSQDQKPFDAMPYVMLTGVPVPGRLWPMTVVELLRGPQTELNKVRSPDGGEPQPDRQPDALRVEAGGPGFREVRDSTTIPGGVYYYDDVGAPTRSPGISNPHPSRST